MIYDAGDLRPVPRGSHSSDPRPQWVGHRQRVVPCRERAWVTVYLVGDGKGVRVRGYGGGGREAGREERQR